MNHKVTKAPSGATWWPTDGWVGFMAVLLMLATVRAAAPATATNAADGRERDLGQGLAYFRVHRLPTDLPPPEAGMAPPCVIDLRYVRSDGAGAGALQAWLASRATVRTPVFVLANGETGPELVAALRGHGPAAGVMLIGIPARDFQPDVAVKDSAGAERQAYDAFEQGATIASLLSDNPGKVRYDETSLGRERKADPPVRPAGEGAGPDSPARPPVDAALQRAVHLHRGLLALRKI